MKRPIRILLVEDDAISSAYMAGALRSAGFDVECAAIIADALALARPGRHGLWLIDAHLPDGSGVDLLASLRGRDPDTPAQAHTASRDPALHAALRSAGFAGVIVKPLGASALVQSVASSLGPATLESAKLGTPHASTPVWDDDVAFRALNGQHGHVATLRELFLDELPHACDRVAKALRAGMPAVARAELHRLRASCGFVGASRLADAVRRLDEAMDGKALAAFEDVVQQMLENGHRQGADPACVSTGAVSITPTADR